MCVYMYVILCFPQVCVCTSVHATYVCTPCTLDQPLADLSVANLLINCHIWGSQGYVHGICIPVGL